MIVQKVACGSNIQTIKTSEDGIQIQWTGSLGHSVEDATRFLNQLEDAILRAKRLEDSEKVIARFESETNRSFNYAGPIPTVCEQCGKLYQFSSDHACFRTTTAKK